MLCNLLLQPCNSASGIQWFIPLLAAGSSHPDHTTTKHLDGGGILLWWAPTCTELHGVGVKFRNYSNQKTENKLWSEPVITESFGISLRKTKLQDPFQIHCSNPCNFLSDETLLVCLPSFLWYLLMSLQRHLLEVNNLLELLLKLNFHFTLLIQPDNTPDSAMTRQPGEVNGWTNPLLTFFS